MSGRSGETIDVVINGTTYRPVDDDEAERLSHLIAEFTLEGTSYWQDLFADGEVAFPPGGDDTYEPGDEEAPFFTEAFLYNLLGKDEARTVLSIVRRLARLAGVKVDV